MNPMALSSLSTYPRKYFFYQEDKSDFVVINPSEVDSLPGLILETPYEGVYGRDLRKALWVNKLCPELAYMVRSFDSENRWMAQLGVDLKRVEFERFADGVRMKDDIVKQWRTVERGLLWFSETLFAAIPPTPASKFPLDPFWPLPAQAGYEHVHRHEHEAYIAAARARDAMGVLAARCTLAIALSLHTILPPPPSHYPPHWVTLVLKKGMSSNWLAAFQNPFISDLSPGIRTGAYVALGPGEARVRWLDHLPVMAAAGLPIYLLLPKPDHWQAACQEFPWLAPLRPSMPDFHAVPPPTPPPNRDPAKVARNPMYGVPRFFRWDRLARWKPPPPPPSEVPAEVPAAPKIPHGPGQQSGESYSEFFARREARAQAIMANESEEARAARLAREQAHAAFNYPPHSIPVFLWVEVGEVDPNVPPEYLDKDYRKLIGKRGRLDTWNQYTVRQKRYDSFHNEWDICPKLCPDDELDDDDDDDDFPTLTFAPLREPARNAPPTANAPSSSSSVPAPTVHPPLAPSIPVPVPSPVLVPAPVVAPTPQPVPSSSQTALPTAPRFNPPHDPQPIEDGEIPNFLTSSFANNLSVFYDADNIKFQPVFDPVRDVLRQHLGVVRVEHPPEEWTGLGFTAEVLRRVVGYLRADEGEGAFDIDDAYLDCMRAFVYGFTKRKPPVLPAAVWDLHALCPENVRRVGYIHPSLQITKQELSRESWYYLRYHADDALQLDWELIVPHATTVVRLLRVHTITNRRAAAEYLVLRGIPFRTIFKPDHRTPMKTQPAPPVSLGWRADSMSLNGYDYRHYESRVYDLLRGPKGRAALLQGGIVWRIAMEILYGGVVTAAIEGPSVDVYRYGQAFRPNRGDDWYDDGLTADEIALICGVYKVCSNWRNTQTSDMSWWPQPHYWNRSSYNVGFWSPWAEGWFLARLSKIRSNEAQPYGSRKWGEVLKTANDARNVRNAVEDASTAFLVNDLRVFVVE